MPGASKLVLVRQLVEAARNNLETATQLLKDLGAEPTTHEVGAKAHLTGSVQRTAQGAVIIEGVFDGQNMVGPDGKMYSVPANYASKSKLVEGDLLKLTISPDGSFIYKQIGPVERERVVGVLARDEQTDEYQVLASGHFYRILLASVTYFKAEMGDEVVILVPKATPSSWAAVENVIKKGAAGNAELSSQPKVEFASDLPAESLQTGVGGSSPVTAAAKLPVRRGRPPKKLLPTPVDPAAVEAQLTEQIQI